MSVRGYCNHISPRCPSKFLTALSLTSTIAPMDTMNVVITVSGTDRSGIIAKVSSALFSYNINIADISQTILSGNFIMMMVADLSQSSITIAELREKADELGKDLGVDIHIMHERVFNAMHRI